MAEYTWKQHLTLANAHKALGHKEIYLSGDKIEDKPWHLVTKCEPGASHRLEIATSVWFYAKDEKTGLEFRWSFDLEPRSANGKGNYEINVTGIQHVISLLPEVAKASFKSYLVSSAKAVRANANKYSQIAQDEYAAASIMENLGA